MRSNRIEVGIEQLLLDPNNYRFIDRVDYKPVADNDVSDKRVQQRAFNFIVGKGNDNIKDLISSFTTNGFLDIDQIQVKAEGEQYLVLEGNRRVATLKYLFDEYSKGNDVGKLEEGDFKSINVVEIIGENPAQHLITMGLHHISGKKRWSAVNEAQLINDLIKKHGYSLEQVCQSLGITKYKLNRSRRTLYLIQQYKDSDFGDQFESNMYYMFETVISTPVIRDWIGWDDGYYKATNTHNLDRFFSWISQLEEVEIDREDNERKTIKEPIITQYRQIKELAEIINDPKALAQMEMSRSLTKAYAYSDAIGGGRVKDALNSLDGDIQLINNFQHYLTDEQSLQLIALKEKLDKLMPVNQALIQINDKKVGKYFDSVATQFTAFHIESYRKLSKIDVKHLSRVNLFAGGNNMGKTSILEAFYILSQLNNINAYLELERYRGKFVDDFQAKWIDKNFTDTIELNGVFNGENTSVMLRNELTEDNIEKLNYLSTIVAEAQANGDILTSNIHLFSNQSPEIRYSKSQILCQAAFTSPYRYNSDLLHRAHSQAVREGYYDRIIQFIRSKLDSSIEKIELINDSGDSRFMVTTSRLSKPLDLTKYGEGLQRVFEIALFMGYCKNGILCIDEIDSALHKSLLIAFTQFIQEMAAEYNVQVFLSTHSKECIDAFVENEYPDDELTAYALTEENGRIVCRFLEGNKLKQLVQSINIDIR
jgi:AAA15 family ATPase/GTPase